MRAPRSIHPRAALAGLLALLAIAVQPARAQTPVVHAVLFYSPTCGHCHYVIQEVLPPLFAQYGDQLQMIGVDVSQPDGQELFLNTLQMFDLESGGVPFLVVGDTYLVGSLDIPELFPGLIEQYLARGGVGWPDIPGLAETVAAAEAAQAAQPTASPDPIAVTPVESTPAPLVLTGDLQADLRARLAQDPAGNGLAIIVLIGMLAAVVWGARFFQRTPGRRLEGSLRWAIPALCLAGLAVAGYLAYVETAEVTAVCGPVGDCNTVQQSQYARLFGVLPIGVLGLAGYILILLAWTVEQRTKGKTAAYAALAILVMALFGTLFSIYLTFLEPFVIGATCAWCLTSSILITALMLLALAPGKLAVRELAPGAGKGKKR